MNIEGLSGLLEDLKFAFALPLVGFIMVVLNVKYSRYSERNALLAFRIGLFFCLLLFLCCFITLMFQDRAILAAVWDTSPILFSLVYLLSGLAIVATLSYLVSTKLRPSLWKHRNTETNA